MPIKKGHKVGHAPVVDVGIGTPQAPAIGILIKMPFHVFVHQLLHVVAGAAQGLHYHIGTHLAIGRYIAHMVRDSAVCRIIGNIRIFG